MRASRIRTHRGLARALVTGLATGALAAGILQAAQPAAAAKVCDGVTVDCAIGDTGPGGGIVFYDAGAAQSWGRYLEAAPAGWVDEPVTPSPVVASARPTVVASVTPAPFATVTPPTAVAAAAPSTAPAIAVAPPAAPGVPRRVRVVARKHRVQVSWHVPAAGGRSVRYLVSTQPASAGCQTRGQSCSIRGLLAGQEYAFTVIAVNDAGQSDSTVIMMATRPAGTKQAGGRSLAKAPAYRSRRASMPMAAPDPGAAWCAQSATGFGSRLPTSTAIGTGRANTGIIVEACGTDSAAGRAAAYRGGGKSDWFLPSKDELNQLWSSKAVVSGLGDGTFWSSSQNAGFTVSAWCQTFANGTQGDNYKDDGGQVRPVRAF